MSKLNALRQFLKPGKVYRRGDLTHLSRSIDRHLTALVKDGTLRKLVQGIYYVPQNTAFGASPPKEKTLVRAFLKDDRFLITSPNTYNNLGVGLTQLYNKRVVYNHKRHGKFNLGGQKFFFRLKSNFPRKVTEEFLLVDLVNNLDMLAEDPNTLLRNVLSRAKFMNIKKLERSVRKYGTMKAKKLLSSLFTK